MSLTFHPVSATARCTAGPGCPATLHIPDASSFAAVHTTLTGSGWGHPPSWPGGQLRDMPACCPEHQPAWAAR